MFKVAIRVPGAKRGTRKTEVLEFRAFYGVLQEMARELRGRGVTHVVMEASGVYTDPVYYALRELDFTEVMVINPAHAKALKGHKTDAKDAIRLLDLYECGLLSGSYMPGSGPAGGAGPGPVPDEDGPGPHLGDPAAAESAGDGRHQARLRVSAILPGTRRRR